MFCRHCESQITEEDIDIGKIDECRECATDVERYVGHMIWDHKTAPALEIHANRRSLEALKDGRYSNGLNLRHEVKERSRRRESDISGSEMSTSPYLRKEMSISAEFQEELPKIEIRQGDGKTAFTFSRSFLESLFKTRNSQTSDSSEKCRVARSLSKISLDKVSGFTVTVWKDASGYYVIPRRSTVRPKIDFETAKSLSYRTSNYSRF